MQDPRWGALPQQLLCDVPRPVYSAISFRAFASVFSRVKSELSVSDGGAILALGQSGSRALRALLGKHS